MNSLNQFDWHAHAHIRARSGAGAATGTHTRARTHTRTRTHVEMYRCVLSLLFLKKNTCTMAKQHIMTLFFSPQETTNLLRGNQTDVILTVVGQLSEEHKAGLTDHQNKSPVWSNSQEYVEISIPPFAWPFGFLF